MKIINKRAKTPVGGKAWHVKTGGKFYLVIKLKTEEGTVTQAYSASKAGKRTSVEPKLGGLHLGFNDVLGQLSSVKA